jgi:hypothetical protein
VLLSLLVLLVLLVLAVLLLVAALYGSTKQLVCRGMPAKRKHSSKHSQEQGKGTVRTKE